MENTNSIYTLHMTTPTGVAFAVSTISTATTTTL
ncbi:hypothetical protein SAMN05444143_1078 [Flavobacterium succinicans]|uniref:Uncharacterized protein n=1 Tax=Flavobacterium succinicans TaxID=29536 RepID=A0A1I4WLT1_9FLAO|nr:hypothetical protein SAMN05444143_1078 [Flavobacterium succinicans]